MLKMMVHIRGKKQQIYTLVARLAATSCELIQYRVGLTKRFDLQYQDK